MAHKSILLIDDDITFLEVLAEYLKRNDYKVTYFDEPTEAISFIETTPPDLILLDKAMRFLDGIDFLKMIRIKGFNGKVLILTGGMNKEDILKLHEFEYKNGYKITEIVYKPIARKELLEIINEAIDFQY